jgi:hypothetical protein
MSLVGEMFLDLLEQDAFWRTGDGRLLPLEAMDDRHRAAVLRMLERMAGELYASWVDEFLIEGLTHAELGALGVSEPDPGTCEYPADEVARWFQRQPLVRCLVTMGAGAVEPSSQNRYR